MAEAVCVDPQRVGEIWPHVSHFAKAAMERGDLGTFASLERDVLSGGALLWLSWCAPEIAGVCITQIARTEKSKVCTILACGGKARARWIQLLNDIERYARAEGCDCVRIFGRKGWMRVLKDYDAPKIILEKRLNG